jgi:hypothetical protein
MNWRGRPLISHQVTVELIAATTTTTGLTVHAELDTGTYPTGLRYSTKQIDALPITRDDFHGEWNYRVLAAHPDTPPAASSQQNSSQLLCAGPGDIRSPSCDHP